jgi:DNA-binding NtrC family response regulator
MDRLEHVAIQQALRLCQGNRTKAASMLGISRDTLYRKLRQNRADG